MPSWRSPPANPHGRRLRKRYGKLRSHLFTFLDHPRLVLDNNGSPSASCVPPRPTARSPGGFRSVWGADFFAAVRSTHRHGRPTRHRCLQGHHDGLYKRTVRACHRMTPRRGDEQILGTNTGVVAYSLLASHVPARDVMLIGANEHESQYLFDICYRNSTEIRTGCPSPATCTASTRPTSPSSTGSVCGPAPALHKPPGELPPSLLCRRRRPRYSSRSFCHRPDRSTGA